MCATCGCSEESVGEAHSHEHGHEHAHEHGHPHSHAHPHDHPHEPNLVQLERDVLAKNQQLAERNRSWFDGRRVLALNLVSSPGSGKTTVLEQTIRALGEDLPVAVIEGDQATELDAERIRATGRPVLQVNTGRGCHLDARMVGDCLQRLNVPARSLLMIENVGNLVCPALFDLGERAKVVVMSVTEGEDKPLKYPHIFHASTLMLLNKIDLLPHVRFDVERCLSYARRVRPDLKVLQISATRGDGMDAWLGWLRAQLPS